MRDQDNSLERKIAKRSVTESDPEDQQRRDLVSFGPLWKLCSERNCSEMGL